jgi:hypothetical protein
VLAGLAQGHQAGRPAARHRDAAGQVERSAALLAQALQKAGRIDGAHRVVLRQAEQQGHLDAVGQGFEHLRQGGVAHAEQLGLAPGDGRCLQRFGQPGQHAVGHPADHVGLTLAVLPRAVAEVGEPRPGRGGGFGEARADGVMQPAAQMSRASWAAQACSSSSKRMSS